MSEKRKPHYDLAAIRSAFADPKALNRTFVSRQGAAALGLDDAAVGAIVQALVSGDFEKSMTSYVDSKIWQDVYRPKLGVGSLYVKFTRDAEGAFLLISSKRLMFMRRRNPRDYPDTMPSAESGRLMTRGEKEVAIVVDGVRYPYLQPGWWCSLSDPDDMEGQLVDEDNQIAEMAERTAKALAEGSTVFVPVVIRAIREACGLTQREAGRIFNTGEKSFEKYESGEIRPSKPTERLLTLAMQTPDLFRKPSPGQYPFPSAANKELIRKTLRAAAMDRIYEPLFEAARTSKSAS